MDSRSPSLIRGYLLVYAALQNVTSLQLWQTHRISTTTRLLECCESGLAVRRPESEMAHDIAPDHHFRKSVQLCTFYTPFYFCRTPKNAQNSGHFQDIFSSDDPLGDR